MHVAPPIDMNLCADCVVYNSHTRVGTLVKLPLDTLKKAVLPKRLCGNIKRLNGCRCPCFHFSFLRTDSFKDSAPCSQIMS